MIALQEAMDFCRDTLASPDGSNPRWNDTQLTRLISQAQRHIVGRVFFPESRCSYQMQSYQNEFTLPQAWHTIYAVYVNGQLASPTSRATLEGRQIDAWDQSGSFSAGGGLNTAVGGNIVFLPANPSQINSGTLASLQPSEGTAAPAGAGGMEQPQWVVQTPTTYPYLNSWGTPRPTAAGFAPGQPPRVYVRNGLLGIVPAPAPGSWIVVDACLVPERIPAPSSSDPLNPNQGLLLPGNFLDALMWRVGMYAQFADNTNRAADQRNYASQMYEQEIRVLRTWKRMYSLESTGPYMLTNRGNYSIGGYRTGASNVI